MQTSLILDKIPIGIIVFNKPKQIISINHNGRIYFDKTNNLLLEVITDLVTKTLDTNTSVEKVIRYSNSHDLFVWRIKTELLFVDYFSPQVMVVIQDETFNSKLGQTILKAEKLAVAGQLAMGSLVEIRNPLTCAQGFCRLIEQSEIHEEYIEIISKELEQIQGIVNNCSLTTKTSQSNNLDVIYNKLLTRIHNQFEIYKLILVRDASDNPVINAAEEHVNILINNLITQINNCIEENVCIIISSELAEESSYLNLNIQVHGDINRDSNQYSNVENTINFLQCRNNQIKSEDVDNNTLALNLEIPIVILQCPN